MPRNAPSIQRPARLARTDSRVPPLRRERHRAERCTSGSSSTRSARALAVGPRPSRRPRRRYSRRRGSRRSWRVWQRTRRRRSEGFGSRGVEQLACRRPSAPDPQQDGFLNVEPNVLIPDCCASLRRPRNRPGRHGPDRRRPASARTGPCGPPRRPSGSTAGRRSQARQSAPLGSPAEVISTHSSTRASAPPYAFAFIFTAPPTVPGYSRRTQSHSARRSRPPLRPRETRATTAADPFAVWFDH